MSDVYNGGITLKIGDYTLRKVSKYTHSYEIIKEKFQNWDLTVNEKVKGSRFKASITTGALTPEELSALRTQLLKNTFDFVSDEYSGAVTVDGISAPLEVANTHAKYYKVSFNVSAVAVTSGSGGL